MSETEGRPALEESWYAVLQEEFRKPYMAALKAFLLAERAQHKVFPAGREMFAAFEATPFPQVRVVILGQDPYPAPGQAHGLSFSVRRGVPLPGSLLNIFQELNQELGLPLPRHGDLTAWARQGVLLLNSTLSVRAFSPNAHQNQGWETFTDQAITALSTQREGLVFVLWGASARRKAALVDRRRHLILEAAHPSPRSADKGFFGCGHFARINAHLLSRGEAPIDWRLPD